MWQCFGVLNPSSFILPSTPLFGLRSTASPDMSRSTTATPPASESSSSILPPSIFGSGQVGRSARSTLSLTYSAAWSALALTSAFLIAREAYWIRLYAIEEYGRVIHEFDPYFNLRATQVGFLFRFIRTRRSPRGGSVPILVLRGFVSGPERCDGGRYNRSNVSRVLNSRRASVRLEMLSVF